jgi:phosphate transport system substrate-binding protein
MTKMIRCLALSGLLVISCGGGDQSEGMRGRVKVDGSSTVFPITEAVAEEFLKIHPRVQVTVGISGTGGGFKKFSAGETDINDASRPIKPIEQEAAEANSIRFIELPVAYDGISVVAHPENEFLDYLTVEELRKIWQPESMVNKWSDIRAEWPDRPLALYGPGTDSGTFDYFTEAVNGKSQVCRPDFTASEDDNVLVQGISGDPDALGFFGFAYYAENASRLKLIPIDGGDGPVFPSNDTINKNTYKPLSRPIFIYVNDQARREEVVAFVEFYLREAPVLAQEVGYVALPAEVYELALKRFTQGVTGTVYSGGHAAGASLVDLFKIGG